MFSSYISDNRPDIACVSETWLDDEVMDAEVECPGYRVFRRDRNLKDYPEGMFTQSARGGVLILVKSDLNPTQANLLDFGTEIIWVSINPSGANSLLLAACYRPEKAGKDYITNICKSIDAKYFDSGHLGNWGFQLQR